MEKKKIIKMLQDKICDRENGGNQDEIKTLIRIIKRIEKIKENIFSNCLNESDAMNIICKKNLNN